MTTKNKKGEQFFGTATVGEKGQIVIPAEAREHMNIDKGDKMLIFGIGADALAVTKLENVEKFASHLSAKLDRIRGAIDRAKS